jgi:hypothetical protein
MLDTEIMTESGLLNFESMAALRKYMGDLLRHYEQESDRYGEKIGKLMRDRQASETHQRNPKLATQNWTKVGLMYVSSRDPAAGILEVLLEALEEYKARAARTSELLKGFEKLEDLNVPKGANLTLFVKNGIPFRLIVDAKPSGMTDKGQIVIPA